MDFFYKGRCDTGIYVLQCEDNCWYVGASSRIQKRLTEHFNGGGVGWTREHTPIDVVHIEQYSDNEHDTWRELERRENELTLSLMTSFGWENVRGGKWHEETLHKKPRPLLESDERPKPQEGTDMDHLQSLAAKLI